MYSYNEISAVELSPTKKDYYQVWNELLDTAGKLSERWDPKTTNESDPGVVLLKVLTAVADKLSYNIDANTLEAFMPSAAQESSMRKLCEMLGYTMRFYRSATTRVRISYKGDVFPSTLTSTINIDRFSNIKNLDNTINYITLEPVHLSPSTRSDTVECIEGTLVTCETNLGNRVTFEHLDDNYRFYLPEHQIASNKIFVSNIETLDTDFWAMVENLNTESLGKKVFKFGYDSSRGLPFLQFPEDVSSLINTGLCIRFIRTLGIKGNVSLNTLKTLEAPASWTAAESEKSDDAVAPATLVEGETSESTEWTDTSLYIVSNVSAAVDGKDPETIDEAYWNFQKTIGTFDTLVTCRDYMNKIYQLTQSEASSTPLVSNVLVSDIRDDINRAYSLSTLTDSGIATKYKVHQKNGKDRIQYFDLVLYPFVTVQGLNTKDEYEMSFKYTNKNTLNILAALEDQKTIAHKFIQPEPTDIACIKAYFQLSARLAITERITALEAEEIKLTAHKALYKEFNMRNISFGEELPFDLILKTLLNSHTKIKNVNLDDPKIYLTVCTVEGKEYPITGNHIFTNLEDAKKARDYYLDLTLKNALAGKLPLFNFDNTFKASLDLAPYPEGFADTNTTSSRFVGEPESLIKLEASSNAATATATINLADTFGKSLYYVSPEAGTLHLYLGDSISGTAFRDKLISFEIGLYGPATPRPIYHLVYTVDNNKLAAELTPASTKDIITYITKEEAVEFPIVSYPLSLCTISFNNTSELIDKVAIKTSVKDAESLETVNLKVLWIPTESTEGTVDTVTYNPFTEGSQSYVTIDDSVKDTFVLKEVSEPLPPIAAIKTNFRVDTDCVTPNDPLVLTENEVIQFRAPNFKTVATYPAYVNYYFKRNSTQGSSKASPAIPATMQTLREFFDGGPKGYYESDVWNKQISWDEKLGSLLATDPTYSLTGNDEGEPEAQTYSLRSGARTATATTGKMASSKFMTTCFKTEEEYTADSPEEATARTQLTRNLTKYGALFTNGVRITYDINSAAKNDKGDWVVSCTIAQADGFNAFVIPSKTKTSEGYGPLVFAIPANTQFYRMKLDSSTFADAAAWLQGREGADGTSIQSVLREDVTTVSGSNLDTEPPRLLKDAVRVLPEKIIQGFYTKKAANLSKKPGYLVDSGSNSYELLTTLMDDLSFDEVYIPRLWADTTDTHTVDGLGTAAIFSGIPADTEYALKQGEYLLFTYSSSEGRDDGVAVVKNIAYSEGTIIKPNFMLMDSADQLEVAPYTKTSDFGPWTLPSDRSIIASTVNGGTIKGMFTLGATDKIEIRERIQVTLEEASAGLFWELKNPYKDSDDYEWLFAPDTYSYILQPGEYLYYTDSAQEAMAYYGSGSEISRGAATPIIKKPASTGQLSADQINKLGLVAAIPWVTVNLSGKQAAIQIDEYQYLNLIAEDQLSSISLTTEGTHILGAEWQGVDSAEYIVSEAEGTLSAFAIPNCGWEVCSRLDLVMGPSTPQTLNIHRSKLGQEIARDIIELYGYDETSSDKLKLTQVYTPLLAKDSAGFVTSADEINSAKENVFEGKIATPLTLLASSYIVSSIGEASFTEESPIALMVGQKKALTLSNGSTFAPLVDRTSPITLGQEHLDAKKPVISLAALVPSEHFGLLSIFVDSKQTSEGSLFIATDTDKLVIFNNAAETSVPNATYAYENWSWWQTEALVQSQVSETNYSYYKYPLKSGLNSIIIPQTSTLKIFAPSQASADLSLGTLKMVSATQIFNPQLAYTSTGAKFALNLVATEQEAELAEAQRALNELIAQQATNAARSVSDADVLAAVNRVSQAKKNLAAVKQQIEEPTESKVISGISYPCIYITEEAVLEHLTNLDPDKDCYYSDITSTSYGIELNAVDKEDTMLLAKNWFDKSNIANKFIVSTIETANNYLEDYVVVSKTSIL